MRAEGTFTVVSFVPAQLEPPPAAFEGALDDRPGGFAYVHSATTTGSDRRYELFVIVPGSGVGDLAGISGGGGMAVDEDDTHRVWFDYQLD
jgi:hypothetical protein